MQVMKGGQIQASGLDHLAGWPRSHVAVVTEGYVPVVCENEAQRLPPIMMLQINIMTCGGQTHHCPKGCRAHRAGSYETSPASIVGLRPQISTAVNRLRPTDFGLYGMVWHCETSTVQLYVRMPCGRGKGAKEKTTHNKSISSKATSTTDDSPITRVKSRSTPTRRTPVGPATEGTVAARTVR